MPPVRHTRTPTATTVNPLQVQNHPPLESNPANAYLQHPAPPTIPLFHPANQTFAPSHLYTMPPKRHLKPAIPTSQQPQGPSNSAQLQQQDYQKQVQQQQHQHQQAQQHLQQQHQHQQVQQQQRQQAGKPPNQPPTYGAGPEPTLNLGELIPGVHQHATGPSAGGYQLPQFHHHGGYTTGPGMENTAPSGMQPPLPPPQQPQQLLQGNQGSMMGGSGVSKRKESISNDPEVEKNQQNPAIGQTQQVGAAAAPAPKRRRSTKSSATAATGEGGTSAEGAKPKARTNKPWTPQEEQRLKQMRDAGSGWGEIAKAFPSRTEGSVKKHWYKDMHYAEFGEDESAALLQAIKEYDANKWKVVGQKVGKPAKACEAYAKEHFQGKI